MGNSKDADHIDLVLVTNQEIFRRQRVEILEFFITIGHSTDGASREFGFGVEFGFFDDLLVFLDDGSGGGVGLGFELHSHHLRKHLKLGFT